MVNWKKDYIILCVGQCISLFTSSVVKMAIIWYLTDKTNSAYILTSATLVGFVPQAVLGLLVGVLVDRFNKKLIMILSDIFIAILNLVLIVSGFFSEIPIILIMIVLFFQSISTAFHTISLQAIIPCIVPKQELTKSASIFQSFESISLILSPAFAIILYGTWKLNEIIIIDVLGAVIAITMLYFIKPNIVNHENKLESIFFIREIKEGINILKKEKNIISLMLIGSLYAMIYFPIGTLYPLITVSYFEKNFTSAGNIEIIFGLGTLLGAFLLSLVSNNINKIKSVKLSIFTYGLCLLIIGLIPKNAFIIFALLTGIMGVSIPFYSSVSIALYQSKFKEEYLGRIVIHIF